MGRKTWCKCHSVLRCSVMCFTRPALHIWYMKFAGGQGDVADKEWPGHYVFFDNAMIAALIVFSEYKWYHNYDVVFIKISAHDPNYIFTVCNIFFIFCKLTVWLRVVTYLWNNPHMKKHLDSVSLPVCTCSQLCLLCVCVSVCLIISMSVCVSSVWQRGPV